MTQTTQDQALGVIAGIQAIIISEVYARVASVPTLAHYTTPGAFRSIVENKELWLSRSADMRDTSEVEEGLRMVGAALDKFGPAILKSINYGASNAGAALASLSPKLTSETYILSLCEHDLNDTSGRLTMWKDFGNGGPGVCMVLKKAMVLERSAKGMFPVHWAPIEYEDEAKLEQRVRRRLEHIERAFAAAPKQVMRTLTPNMGFLLAAFVIQLVVSHKNKHYYDDKEVRFLRSDYFNQNLLPTGAALVEKDTPKGRRTKFILPLRDYPEYGIDATLDCMLDHVLLGPTKDQGALYKEIKQLLSANGLGNVRVNKSDIPYRSDL